MCFGVMLSTSDALRKPLFLAKLGVQHNRPKQVINSLLYSRRTAVVGRCSGIVVVLIKTRFNVRAFFSRLLCALDVNCRCPQIPLGTNPKFQHRSIDTPSNSTTF